jgi:hypothetical protein
MGTGTVAVGRAGAQARWLWDPRLPLRDTSLKSLSKSFRRLKSTLRIMDADMDFVYLAGRLEEWTELPCAGRVVPAVTAVS